LLTVVLLVGALYFARVVLVPLAMAVLLAFLLVPVVEWLQRRGLWQAPAVLLAVVFSMVVIGGIATVMTTQLTDLAHRLPDYQNNVHQKLKAIRDSGGGVINRMTRWGHGVTAELTPPPAPAPPGQPAPTTEPKPVPVEVMHTTFSPLESLPTVLGSVINILLTSVIVIVFVIFMLIQRKDLRKRLIRLAGDGPSATAMLDDAAQRVSRYLLAQFLMNSGYGVAMGLALYFIGVPNPLLWGLLAAIFRYVPYLGIWIAAIMPAAVAFAVEPGWVKMPLILGVYVGVDVLMYNFAEPLLYRNSTGISPLALLVAAVFWTWLWGGAGLLLSTPLTVLVLVLGRQHFEFLGILLSDEPAPPVEAAQPARSRWRRAWRPHREARRAS
jgi:predicted PurR-regulated permease PerM